MPLANSMTCAENLIGFNSDGYKALSRFLNIQVFIDWNNTIYNKKVLWESYREMIWWFLVKHSCILLWINMWLLEQDHQLTPCGIRKKLDLIKWVEWMTTTFCTWSVVLVETNSNPACLGEEVDNLMKVDKEPNLILLARNRSW